MLAAAIDGDRSLWSAVILQAFSDATGKTDERNSNRRELDAAQARSWLTSNSADFRRVCDFAGILPGAVHGQAIKLQAENWKRPGWLPRYVDER